MVASADSDPAPSPVLAEPVLPLPPPPLPPPQAASAAAAARVAASGSAAAPDVASAAPGRSSSRAICYASDGDDFADAARREALRTRDGLEAAKP